MFLSPFYPAFLGTPKRCVSGVFKVFQSYMMLTLLVIFVF